MRGPRKDKSVLVRFTEEELTAIDVAVELMGYDTRSNFIRQVAKMAINPTLIEMRKRGLKANEVLQSLHANQLEQQTVFDK